jgi:hypothetical protein
MRVSISWSDEQLREVRAALDEGSPPQLDPPISAMVRSVGEQQPIELSLQEGQLLKRWCEARREQATEQQPDSHWTRIVAKVNEAVQLAAPAKP